MHPAMTHQGSEPYSAIGPRTMASALLDAAAEGGATRSPRRKWMRKRFGRGMPGSGNEPVSAMGPREPSPTIFCRDSASRGSVRDEAFERHWSERQCRTGGLSGTIRRCRSGAQCLSFDHAGGRDGAETRADAADRSATPGDALLRRPADDLAAPVVRGSRGAASACRRAWREPEAHPATHARLSGKQPPDCFLNLLTVDLPKAQHQQAEKGAQHLSLWLGQAAGGSPRPGLVRRRHLSADAAHSPGSNRWHRDGAFLYPGAIMDWFTRKVLAWRISNRLEADCLASRR